jgi:quercetin dioxygenase-like cupin family protein
MSLAETRLISSDSGDKFFIAGGIYRIVLSGKQTGGTFAMIEMEVPPGAGPGPHSHPDFQETFYVLEGEVEFTSETGKGVAGKGALIHIPLNGPVHCFKNKSSVAARLLCTVVPSGLDEFFATMGKPLDGEALAPQSPPDPERMRALAEQFGTKLYPPDYFG